MQVRDRAANLLHKRPHDRLLDPLTRLLGSRPVPQLQPAVERPWAAELRADDEAPRSVVYRQKVRQVHMARVVQVLHQPNVVVEHLQLREAGIVLVFVDDQHIAPAKASILPGRDVRYPEEPTEQLRPQMEAGDGLVVLLKVHSDPRDVSQQPRREILPSRDVEGEEPVLNFVGHGGSHHSLVLHLKMLALNLTKFGSQCEGELVARRRSPQHVVDVVGIQ
mmetsp:Transcript_44282/g.111282  ORF Transcript_44282/g.111282 Transcript_44282/m.111282 type:complete len:221 (-) Transcript_44282:417-1079(-)